MERSARAEHQDPQFVNPRFFVKFQARPANSAVIQTHFKDKEAHGEFDSEGTSFMAGLRCTGWG